MTTKTETMTANANANANQETETMTTKSNTDATKTITHVADTTTAAGSRTRNGYNADGRTVGRITVNVPAYDKHCTEIERHGRYAHINKHTSFVNVSCLVRGERVRRTFNVEQVATDLSGSKLTTYALSCDKVSRTLYLTVDRNGNAMRGDAFMFVGAKGTRRAYAKDVRIVYSCDFLTQWNDAEAKINAGIGQDALALVQVDVDDETETAEQVDSDRQAAEDAASVGHCDDCGKSGHEVALVADDSGASLCMPCDVARAQAIVEADKAGTFVIVPHKYDQAADSTAIFCGQCGRTFAPHGTEQLCADCADCADADDAQAIVASDRLPGVVDCMRCGNTTSVGRHETADTALCAICTAADDAQAEADMAAYGTADQAAETDRRNQAALAAIACDPSGSAADHIDAIVRMARCTSDQATEALMLLIADGQIASRIDGDRKRWHLTDDGQRALGWLVAHNMTAGRER